MSLRAMADLQGRVIGLLNRNRSALAALVVRGAGVIAGFGLTFLIARWFGPTANGVYALVTQSAIFLSVVAVGGLDLAVVREFSRSVALGQPLARRAIWGVLIQTTTLALLLGGAVLLFEPVLVPRLIGEVAIADLGLILAVLILLRALMRIIAAILRSQSQFSRGQAIELFLLPVATIVLLFVWGAKERQIDTILQASVLAAGLVVALGTVLAFRGSSGSTGAVTVSQKTLFVGALPMWGMAIAQNLADWFGLVSVNYWAGTADAGIYRVGWQIASVLPIVALSLLGTFTARIAAAIHAGRRDEMARLSRTATMLALLIFGPIALVLFLFAEPILAAFGPEFVSGAATLRVLVVGSLLVAGFGIAGQVLVMIGQARLNLMVNLGTTLVILIGAPLAAALAGGFGVALLITVLNGAKTVVYFFAVRRLEGFNAFTGRLLSRG
jgi:O-antigen/teichoic acid export membrane protein